MCAACSEVSPGAGRADRAELQERGRREVKLAWNSSSQSVECLSPVVHGTRVLGREYITCTKTRDFKAEYVIRELEWIERKHQVTHCGAGQTHGPHLGDG